VRITSCVKHTEKLLVFSMKNGTKTRMALQSCTLIFTVCPYLVLLREFAINVEIGLHPDESVSYLEGILLKHSSSSRPVYAITGTGHHSKNGKDKVGKAIRGFLNEWRYAFREFSVPGDRNNVGGILGIDPSSYDKSVAERPKESESEVESAKKDTKIRIMKRDEILDVPKGPKRAA
jgi:hypothetical protein